MNTIKLSLSRIMSWVLNSFAPLKKYILHVGCIVHVYVLRLIEERWSSDQNWFVLFVVIPQVTNAQLEALRIENRHLREAALNDQLTVRFADFSHTWAVIRTR